MLKAAKPAAAIVHSSWMQLSNTIDFAHTRLEANHTPLVCRSSPYQNSGCAPADAPLRLLSELARVEYKRGIYLKK